MDRFPVLPQLRSYNPEVVMELEKVKKLLEQLEVGEYFEASDSQRQFDNQVAIWHRTSTRRFARKLVEPDKWEWRRVK